MSETESEGQGLVTPEKPPHRSGFSMYDEQLVTVQLRNMYIAGYKDGQPLGTEILEGKLKITPGLTPGSLLFILGAPDQNGNVGYISIYPEDVAHITCVQQSLIKPP
jgi:hypothetical protein